ncbi:MAG: dihydroneopterin aldolase [Bdellovibrionota bacterium]
MSPSSYVQVKDLVIQTHIGAGEHGLAEQAIKQNIGVDIKVFFDGRQAAQSDQLIDTLDYAHLTSMIQSTANEKPRHLLENLAFDIAKTLFQTYSALQHIDISLEKYSVSSHRHVFRFNSQFSK